MKKNMLGMLGFLSLGLLFGGFTTVNAAETDFASCVKQDECVLESDVTINSTITLENDLILDLNGHKITANISNQNTAAFETSYKLTIKDTKGNGMIDASNSYGIMAYEGGTLILDSGEIKALNSPFSGNNTKGDMNFIVNGGTLTSIQGAAIYMPGQENLEINDGTLNGGINVRMGQITINGGKIINNNPINTDSIDEYYDYNGNVWFSNALTVFGGTYTSENTEYGNSLNMVINGGTFESSNGNALTIYALGKVKQDINVTINGGTFNGKEMSVAVENPESLKLEDANYTKVVNEPNVVITSGTFNSNIESLVQDGYKVVENNGVYNVEPNLVISTSDNNVVMESEKPLPNDYQLVVAEKDLTDTTETVISDTQKLIIDSLKEYNVNFGDTEILATYDINVYNGAEIVKIEGTDKYKISINLDENLLSKYAYVKVAYINEDGKVESIYDSTVENGIVSFETTHLSTYSIIGYNVELTSVAVENPSTNDNVLAYAIIGTISLIGLAGAAVYLKRHN